MTDPLPSTEKDAHPADNGTTVTNLNDRAAILCRTCLRPLTWETHTEAGFNPRTGFYDDARSDALVCFKSVDYQHHPLTDREWAYYEAGQASVDDCAHEAEAHNLAHEVDRVRERLWRLAALAGWRPGNPADNDATAELYVTDALRTCVTSPGGSDA